MPEAQARDPDQAVPYFCSFLCSLRLKPGAWQQLSRGRAWKVLRTRRSLSLVFRTTGRMWAPKSRKMEPARILATKRYAIREGPMLVNLGFPETIQGNQAAGLIQELSCLLAEEASASAVTNPLGKMSLPTKI